MTKVPPILSAVQVQQLVAGHKQYPKYQHMIKLFYDLGIRVNELVSIRLSDISSANRTIMIRGKGSKQRVLPLPPMAYEMIKATYNMYVPGTFLFENMNGKPYTTRGVRNIVADAAKKAGLHHVWPHLIRHSRATNLVNKHVGLWHIQQLLGHSEMRTTSKYLHYAVEDLRKVLSENY